MKVNNQTEFKLHSLFKNVGLIIYGEVQYFGVRYNTPNPSDLYHLKSLAIMLIFVSSLSIIFLIPVHWHTINKF